tara:strand:+ start:5919 stop:7367 length:1449 start_codon:yes stop_codon:yes gene_type:complete
MKKILFIIIANILMLSCEKELIEHPKSLAVETFYNTTSEMDAAVAAIYAPLRDPNCLGALYPGQMEAYSDFFYGRGSYAVLSTFQGLDGNNTNRVGAIWNLFYLAIRNANIVIQNTPDGKELTEIQKSQYIAEAKFLRALTYFFMVRNWSGVPLRTEANMNDIEIPRSSEEDVYQLILEDLAFAESNLPETASLPGKPAKLAATTLLADVYFYKGDYPLARDKANEVILSGKYSLVAVENVEDFNKIYGPDVVTSPEEIFYLKYSHLGNNEGWYAVMLYHHPGAKMHGAGGFYAHYSDLITNSVIANWDQNDLRFHLWYNWDIGLGSNTILNKKFSDPSAPGNYGAANDFPLYRFADVLLIYAESQCRASGAPTEDAIEKLNMVHRRAYGRDATTPDPTVDFKLEDYDKDSFVDLCIKERGYETQAEGKRWPDLKRTGEVKERIKATTGKDVADKHLLWPIPVSELNYNSAINPSTDQNPGY